MKRLISIVVTVLLTLTSFAQLQRPSRSALLNPGEPDAEMTAQGPCPPVPTDVTAKQTQGYGRAIDPGDQQPFDEFSWQSFVALNCPATDRWI